MIASHQISARYPQLDVTERNVTPTLHPCLKNAMKTVFLLDGIRKYMNLKDKFFPLKSD